MSKNVFTQWLIIEWWVNFLKLWKCKNDLFNDNLLTDNTNQTYFKLLLYNLARWVSQFWAIWLSAEAKFDLILGQKYDISYSLSKMSKEVSNE